MARRAALALGPKDRAPGAASSSLARGRPGQARDRVADYYDRFTSTYLKATGPFLQAFRNRDTDALMDYYVGRCGIEDGMTVLDAGCGVAAPAIWLARRFPALTVEGLTNSNVQAGLAQRSARDFGVDDRVLVKQGDYHALGDLYAHGRFDRALFLESLGHSADIRAVLRGVRDVLKPGARVYIKDFFQRRSHDPGVQREIDRAVATIDSNYCYHVMRLPELIAACLEAGLAIDAVSPPAIEPDLQLTIEFEEAAGRLTYPAFAKVHAVDWYEVIARRE